MTKCIRGNKICIGKSCGFYLSCKGKIKTNVDFEFITLKIIQEEINKINRGEYDE